MEGRKEGRREGRMEGRMEEGRKGRAGRNHKGHLVQENI